MLRNGDAKSAVCLIDTVHEADAGGIYLKEEFDVGLNETNTDIECRVAQITIELLSKYLSCPEKYAPVPQTGTPVITGKISKSDLWVDMRDDPLKIHNMVRAHGFANTVMEGRQVKILKTRFTDGKMEILLVQLPGGRPMTRKDFQNGYVRR